MGFAVAPHNKIMLELVKLRTWEGPTFPELSFGELLLQ
jgi:hypothetical protein